MKTYYSTPSGIITDEHFVPKNHPQYDCILEEIKNNEARLIPHIEITATHTWESIRNKRNRLLKESDWAVLPDSPVLNRDRWINYRSLLRQIPQLYKEPNKVVWPITPR